MASVDFAAGSNVNDILMFGRYCQTILAMETGSIDGMKPLSPEEAAYISGTVAYDDSTAAIVCKERLDLGVDYYYAVKQQITSLLRVWDAVLDEKRRYDTVGWLERTRTFMDAFQLCSYLIPKRASIGLFRPEMGFPQVGPNNSIPALSPEHSYYSATSTIVNTPIDQAGYENFAYDSGYEERISPENEGYPESLAISPTVYESLENGGFGEGGAGLVSLSSDDDASGSEYSYHSDSDDSDQSEGPDPAPKLQSSSGLKAGLRDPGLCRLDDSEYAPWERLLNNPNNLPEARQPYQYQQEMQRDENVGNRRPVSNKRKARSLDLDDLPPKRGKVLAVHGSDGRRARGGSDHLSKRLRTL